MFEFSGRAPRAGLETLVGRIRPAGRTLETPALAYHFSVYAAHAGDCRSFSVVVCK